MPSNSFTSPTGFSILWKIEASVEKNDDLIWFSNLTPDEMSAYIGEGHILDDYQFDYIVSKNMTFFVRRYLNLGRRIPDNQIKQIVCDPDLSQVYIQSRMLSTTENTQFSRYEYFLVMNYLIACGGSMKDGVLKEPAKFGYTESIIFLVEKGANITDDDINSAKEAGHIRLAEYLKLKKSKIIPK